jgi:hypothetical protein
LPGGDRLTISGAVHRHRQLAPRDLTPDDSDNADPFRRPGEIAAAAHRDAELIAGIEDLLTVDHLVAPLEHADDD